MLSRVLVRYLRYDSARIHIDMWICGYVDIGAETQGHMSPGLYQHYVYSTLISSQPLQLLQVTLQRFNVGFDPS